MIKAPKQYFKVIANQLAHAPAHGVLGNFRDQKQCSEFHREKVRQT